MEVYVKIYFPKKNPAFPTFDNSRPITKTSPIYKLLETILNEKLKKQLDSNQLQKINECQLGFQKGLNCELNILRYKEIVKEKMNNLKMTKSKKKLTTVLNDLKSAFDNVPHEILFKKKLPSFGIS